MPLRIASVGRGSLALKGGKRRSLEVVIFRPCRLRLPNLDTHTIRVRITALFGEVDRRVYCADRSQAVPAARRFLERLVGDNGSIRWPKKGRGTPTARTRNYARSYPDRIIFGVEQRNSGDLLWTDRWRLPTNGKTRRVTVKYFGPIPANELTAVRVRCRALFATRDRLILGRDLDSAEFEARHYTFVTMLKRGASLVVPRRTK